MFCLVDPVGAAGLHLAPDVTGVWMVPEARATLDLALRLQPDTRRAVVVGGASALDQAYLEEVRRELARNPPPLELSYLAGLPMDDLRKGPAGVLHWNDDGQLIALRYNN